MRLRANADSSDALASLLHDISPNGIVETREPGSPDVWLEAYLPANDEACTIIDRLRESPLLQDHPLFINQIRQEDWIVQWRQQHHPLLLAQHLYIRPPWDESAPPTGAISLTIEPCMAFGTGRHETTQLCVQGLVERLEPGMQVLDLGCGSGILALAAAKLGATAVLALDIDPVAVQAARKNANINDLRANVQIERGSLATILHSPRRFDLALVNIVGTVILQLLAGDLVSCLRPGGRALFSGILASELAEIIATLPSAGFEMIAQRALGEWHYIEAIAKHDN